MFFVDQFLGHCRCLFGSLLVKLACRALVVALVDVIVVRDARLVE